MFCAVTFHVAVGRADAGTMPGAGTTRLFGVIVLAEETFAGRSIKVTVSSSVTVTGLPVAGVAVTAMVLPTTPGVAVFRREVAVTQSPVAALGTRGTLRSCQRKPLGRAMADQATPLPGAGRVGSVLARRAAVFSTTVSRTPVVAAASAVVSQ